MIFAFKKPSIIIHNAILVHFSLCHHIIANARKIAIFIMKNTIKHRSTLAQIRAIVNLYTIF